MARSAIDDINYGLRRNLGGMLAGREPYYGQGTFTANGVPGQTPDEVTREAGVSPLPVYAAPVARGLRRLRSSIDAAFPDPLVQRFAADQSVDADARRALLRPYGYAIDQF